MTPRPVRLVRVATRTSALARWQADHVAGLLRAAAAAAGDELAVEVVGIETTADRRQDVPIWSMGGKGAFVAEVRAAVLEGRADLAVHSAKDLPSAPLAGLALAAVPRRADPRDVVVGSTLDGLAPGAVVATGSVRRRAQLAWSRPDLTFTGLRGNIATRLGKVPPGGAVVVAAAALDRLGIDLGGRGVAHEVLEPSRLLPQVGQGALAVEVAEGARELAALVALVEDGPSRVAVDAERAYLATLGGDCDLPAGALAAVGPGGEVALEVVLASLDGHVVLRHREAGPDPAAVGRAAARHLLDHAGGASLLAT